MGRFIVADMHDQALAYGAACTRVSACSAQPLSIGGIPAVSLGEYTLVAGSGNGDWEIEDGAVNGRRLRIVPQTGNNAATTGTANHLAYDNGAQLRMVSIAAPKALEAGQPFEVNGYVVVNYNDPIAA